MYLYTLALIKTAHEAMDLQVSFHEAVTLSAFPRHLT